MQNQIRELSVTLFPWKQLTPDQLKEIKDQMDELERLVDKIEPFITKHVTKIMNGGSGEMKLLSMIADVVGVLNPSLKKQIDLSGLEKQLKTLKGKPWREQLKALVPESYSKIQSESDP